MHKTAEQVIEDVRELQSIGCNADARSKWCDNMEVVIADVQRHHKHLEKYEQLVRERFNIAYDKQRAYVEELEKQVDALSIENERLRNERQSSLHIDS